MLLGELDLNAAPAVGALGRLDSKFKGTTSGLSRLGGRISSLTAGFLSLSAVVAAVHATLDLAGVLNDMSLRTGESVRDLVTLREAFTEAGLGAEGVEPFLLKLDNALGGVNEEGGKTAAAFKALGTSAAELAGQDAIGKIQTLQRGIAGIADQGDRVQAMRNIFGKGGGQMLSLLGDPKVLGQSTRRAETLATVLDRNRAVFDDLGDSLGALKLDFYELYAGALSKIAPAISTLADQFGRIDFAEIGRGIGTLVSPIVAVTKAAAGMGMMISDAADALAQFFRGEKTTVVSPSDRAIRGHAARKRGLAGVDSGTDAKGFPLSSLGRSGLDVFSNRAANPERDVQRRTLAVLERIERNTASTPGGTRQPIAAPAV